MLKSWRIRFSALNVALGFAVVTLAVLAFFATLLWYAWRHSIEQGRTELLQVEAQQLRQLYVNQGLGALEVAIQNQVGTTPTKPGQLALLTDSSLNKLAGNLPAWPQGIEPTGIHSLVIADRSGEIQATVLYELLPNGYRLLVGRDVSRFEELETFFLYGLAGSGTLVLAIAIVGGKIIRGALLSQVHRIRQTASRIVEGDLSRRLPDLGGGDELDMLTLTINRMLEQIEKSVHGVRNTSNAIAHDLRTPLTELRARLEVLTMTRPSQSETFSEIDNAIADVDRVLAIFNALLRLAEIDSGVRRSGFVEVDVASLASEVTEFYQPVAELKGIKCTFSSSGDLKISGDAVLLAQAIGNLLDNAVKYGPHNGEVAVEAVQRTTDVVEVYVSDNGPGISADEKHKVIERFYRSDASRASPGVGLGLSLVDAVARLHGGSLELDDNGPGLRARLLLAQRDIEKLARTTSSPTVVR